MNKGKSNYTIQFNCDSQIVSKIIIEWLNNNKFKLIDKYGEQFYHYRDAWNGNRGFQYNINGNTLNIYAWTIGLGNTFYMLDSGAPNNMAGDSYKNLLNSIFSRLNDINNENKQQELTPAINNNTQSQTTTNTNHQEISQFSESFKLETEKKKEKLCNIGFILSIVGVIISFFGFSFGIFLYIINFYLASQGLQTNKKGKAIASIILSIISIFIVLIQIF